MQGKAAILLAALCTTAAAPAHADEGGVSFWLPGQYASFAAIAPIRAERSRVVSTFAPSDSHSRIA